MLDNNFKKTNHHKSKTSGQQGQSLIEVVFALGILLMVVSAILALTISNLVGQKESEFQIIANNLAREGIEVVRNIRDSNWLVSKEWDDGLVDPTEASNKAVAQFRRSGSESIWQLKFNPNIDEELLYLASDGVYSHEIEAGSKPSVFRRYLELETVCLCFDSNKCSLGQETIKSNCGAGEQKIGIKISSVVEWAERGRKRKVNLEDLIYDWK